MNNPIALIGRTATYLILSLAAFVSVFPFFWMLIGSTNTNADLIRGKATPGDALWRNIEVFFTSADLPRVVFNSFFIAGVGTIDAEPLLLLQSMRSVPDEVWEAAAAASVPA